jgi:hypothetical protein
MGAQGGPSAALPDATEVGLVAQEIAMASSVFDPDPLEPRRGTPDPQLDEAEFRHRFASQFQDPAFAPLASEIGRITEAAWDAYTHARKSPHTRKAGGEFHDPNYDLSTDWIAARDAVAAAQTRHDNSFGPARILLIAGSARSEHTCPGEMSKSYRLMQIARAIFVEREGVEVEMLELHR